MHDPVIAAIITASAGVFAALYTKGKWWGEKSESDGTNAIGALLFKSPNKGPETKPSKEKFRLNAIRDANGLVASTPNMLEIKRAISEANPFNQIQIAKNYVGLKVCWPVVFSNVTQYDFRWSVVFDDPNDTFMSVTISIEDIDQIPKLKVISCGHPAWVEGTISHADYRDIYLDDTTIVLE